MKTILVFFLAALAVASVLAFVFYRLGLLMANLEEQLVGIWVNATGSVRVLIYRAETSLQGDIVWVGRLDEDVLGAGILRGITIKGRKGAEGHYVEPLTHAQHPVRLRLKGRNLLSLQIYPGNNFDEKPMREEQWQRVDP